MVLRCLSPEQTGQGEFRHSRFGSSGESEVEDHREEAPVKGSLEQADQAEIWKSATTEYLEEATDQIKQVQKACAWVIKLCREHKV